MSFYTEQREAEREEHRRISAYYTSIRRPWLERVTFPLALLAAIAVSLRRFGIGITDYENQGQWLTLFYWVSLFAFLFLDSILAKTYHPIPIAFGGCHPGRICEKFVMQGRAWQLLLVLMLPMTARLIQAIVVFVSTH